MMSRLFELAVKLCSQSIKCIYKALFTSADVTRCYTETQAKTPKQQAIDVEARWLGKTLYLHLHYI
jgi:hypothetical protein